MKAKYLFLVALVALPLVSCKKDSGNDSKAANYQEMTFTASIPAVDGISTAWASGDAISVFDGKANQKFTASGAGQSASFVGTANADATEFQAVSPYNASLSRKSGKVTLGISASQPAVKDGFNSAYNYAVAYTTGSDLSFTNVPAYAKLTVNDKSGIVSIQIEAIGGEQIAGDVEVALQATPTVTPAGAGSKITLSGTDIAGTYYAIAVPQTLASGYKISFTDVNDSRAEVEVSASTVLKSGEVTDLGSFSNLDWVEAVNPNPTIVPGAVIMKATFEEADFNLVSEGDWDTYADQALYYRTSWIDPASDLMSYTTGQDGSKALRIENNTPGVWIRQNQCIQLNRGAKYTFSVDAQLSDANTNCYAGLNSYWGNILYEILGWAGEWASGYGQWAHFTKDIENPSDFYGDIYLGEWGDADHWIEADNFSFVPQGYTAKSMDPVSSEIIGTISNATYDEVEGLGKVIAWMDEDNNVKLAFSNVDINGTVYPTAIASTESSDPTKIEITKFNKASGVISDIVPLENGQISVVPDAAFIQNGKTYLHYYATLAENSVDDWSTDYATFVESSDNGKTWTRSNETVWAGNGHFAEAGFVNHDGYTYMIGTYAGRDSGYWANMFGARVADGGDFTDPNAYSYWVNPGWSNEGEPADMTFDLLSVGPRAEPAVIYNPKFQRYMMIYRASSLGGLMYRDSSGPDENGFWYWSGEKILTDDDETGALFAPSVLKVNEDGSIIFIASQL